MVASERLSAPKPETAVEKRRKRRNGLRWILLEAVVVMGAFTALAIWLTWPVSRDLRGSMFGHPGDSTGAVSLLDWFGDGLGYHLLGTSNVQWIGAPFGSEFPNALNIQWLLLFGPATLVTKLVGEVAAYNLLVISGLALSGASMYLLVRLLGCPAPVAAWSGLAYTIFPWHIEKAEGHVGFVHLEGFPVLLLAILAWHRRPTIARAFFVAGATLLLWLTAGYFGVLASVSAATLVTLVFLLQWRRIDFGSAARRYVLVGSLVVAVPVVVYAASISGNPTGVGNPRSAAELSYYGARPWEYVLPSYRNPYFGDDVGPWLVGHLHGSNFSETSLYVGWLTILLALVWLGTVIVRRVRLSQDEVFLAFALPTLVVVAGLFSLPSPIPHTQIPTPSRILWELTPQFRVPSRFVSVIMTALVVAAALGLTAVLRAVAKRGCRARHVLATAVCAGAAAISLVELTVSTSPSTFDVSKTPRYYALIERAPRGILAEYPLARADQAVNSDYLFWQRRHHRPILNGAQLGSFPDEVGQAVADPASPETPGALSALGVTSIVTRPSTYQFTGGALGAPTLGAGYRRLGEADGATVWKVVARPAPAIAAFGPGFGGTETPPGHRASRWLGLDEGRVDLYASRAGTYVARFSVASFGRPRIVRLRGAHGGRRFVVPQAKTIAVPIRLKAGRSHLLLDARPGPQRIPDGRSVSVYVSNWGITRERNSLGAPIVPWRN